MGELIEAVVSWPTLVMVLLVFGLFPGTVLRLFVRCYPKGDPRRNELIGDLYVKSYIERPLFAVSAGEMAIHEGLALRWAAWWERPYSRFRARTLALLWTSIAGLAATSGLLLADRIWPVLGVALIMLTVCGAFVGLRYYVLVREGTAAMMQAPRFSEIGRRLARITARIQELRVGELPDTSVARAAQAQELADLQVQLAEAREEVRGMDRSWWTRLIVR